MAKFWHFLQYHNAVPVAISFLLLGAGGAFAATNPEAIYSQTETVLSVDNTYIANKDLSTYTPRVQIGVVTEDADNYYVEYTLFTIDVDDYVWKDVERKETMTVSKAGLGAYRDLGLYVTEQLKQMIDRNLAYLREVQESARKNISQKMVATAYGGLVGRMLDDRTDTLPGYMPVVDEPKAPEGQFDPPQSDIGQAGSGTPQQPQQSGAPVIQILGNNPARIPKGTMYADLGVIVTDAANDNLGVKTFVNGKEVQYIEIDTSALGTWTIRYESTNPAGQTSSAERTVEVYDQYAPQEPQTPVEQQQPTPQQNPPPQESSTPSEPQTSAPEEHPATTTGETPTESGASQAPASTTQGATTPTDIGVSQQQSTTTSGTETQQAAPASETSTTTTP